MAFIHVLDAINRRLYFFARRLFYEYRYFGFVHHFFVGQRARHDVSRIGARIGRARPRRAVSRTRRAVVCVQPRFAQSAVGTNATLSRIWTNSKPHYARNVREADLVIVGSYVPDGVEVGDWAINNAGGVAAFYDIDTPVTLAKLERGDNEYLSPALIPRYDAYLSFSGGPTLQTLERKWGSPCARAFYCSVDETAYFPESTTQKWDLGYLGTYSDDRQPPLEKLLIEPAQRWNDGDFCVAGPQYPPQISWPRNVHRIEHLPPTDHREFYNAQRFTLNITRADMIRAGYSPSVRLFEAAACGVPIISDYWDGLNDFFEIGREILVAHSAEDALRYLRETSDEERAANRRGGARQSFGRAHGGASRARVGNVGARVVGKQ